MSVELENQNIITKGIKEILVDNAKEYYEEIICHRPIPDTRDGLTEVQRRILFATYLHKWNSSKPHVKSAKICGAVIGDLHPHGDSSVYEASVNMTQPWKNHIPMMDFHGNMGGISGASAGAMRYTEMRSSKFSEKLLLDNMGDNAVDFIPTYDNADLEPLFLPSKYPNYLVNGAFGIAAGYAVSVLPHNPKDVIGETIKRVENPTYEIDILPDLPTGGIIINTDEVREAYKKGQGRCILRAKLVLDEKKNIIHLTEIPYMKTVNGVMKSIIEATKEKDDPNIKGKKLPPKITSIKNVKDATEKNKPDIIIEAKRDADLNVLVAQLFEHTMCQVTIPIIFLGTINRNFKVYNGGVTEVIDEWIDFRRITVQRIKMDYIKKYKLRVHILEGIINALNNIDTIIKDIKKCKSKKETIQMLMEKYDMSEIQGEKVAEIPLYRLGALQINVFIEEKEELLAKIEEELSFFKNRNKLNKLIIEELKEISKLFSKQTRKTELQNISYTSEEEKINAIPDEDYLMLCTKNSFIKKLQMPKSQNRGGKGISVGKLKEDDYVINSTVLNSRDSIFIFTEEGNVFKFKVYEIPTHETKHLGYNIKNSINNETVVSMLPVKEKDLNNDKLFFMMATEFNRIKLMNISEFKNVRNTGILYTRLEDIELEGETIKDRVISVEKIDISVHDSIIALNNLGNAIRVKLEDIPVSLRPAFGSNLFETKLIKEFGGCVTSVTLVDETKSHYFLITQNGLGKRMLLEEFEPQKRCTKGKMACKLKDDDCAIKLLPVSEEGNIIIISNKNIMSVQSNKISVSKRPTYGCTVKKVTNEEFVIDCITE